MPKVTKRYKMPHKRRLRKKTDYVKRLALVKSGLPRTVIRKSVKNMAVQIINWEPAGDKVVVSSSTKSLRAYGWNAGNGNVPAAYLAGLLAGLRAKANGVEKAVLDIGLQKSTKGSRIYAALKGLLDAGLDVPHDAKVLPSEKRIRGEHIAVWAAAGGKGFADIPKHFDEVKQKIISAPGKEAKKE